MYLPFKIILRANGANMGHGQDFFLHPWELQMSKSCSRIAKSLISYLKREYAFLVEVRVGWEKGVNELPHLQVLTIKLWSRTDRNPDEGTGPLACPFFSSLAAHSRLLATHCSLHSALLRTFVCLLAHSFTPELVGKWIIRCLKMAWLCPIVR